MKKITLSGVICLIAFIGFLCPEVVAQATTSSAPGRSDSNQILRDVLNELRQLRADLLRLNIHAYRTQSLIDRRKVQQELALRLNRDLDNARNELAAIRSRREGLKDGLEVLEKKKAAGIVGDDEIKALTAELEELKERERGLREREPMLSVELNASRTALAQLDARLDDLEQEFAKMASDLERPQKKN